MVVPQASSTALGSLGGVEERFRKRLAMSKRQFISKEGRIPIFSSIYHVNLLCLFSYAKGWEGKAWEIQLDFLWGENTLEKKPPPIK